MIWRRLLVSAESSIADLHATQRRRERWSFKRYQQLLRAELDIEPTAKLREPAEPPEGDVTPR